MSSKTWILNTTVVSVNTFQHFQNPFQKGICFSDWNFSISPLFCDFVLLLNVSFQKIIFILYSMYYFGSINFMIPIHGIPMQEWIKCIPTVKEIKQIRKHFRKISVKMLKKTVLRKIVQFFGF